MALTHEQITERLEEIEADLAERQPKYERSAELVHRLRRDAELRQARAFMAAHGKTATERKQEATIAIAAAPDNLYSDLLDAEGVYEGLRAAVKVLEQRAMIGMSLLRASTRESGPAPQWSGSTERALAR
jgi:hypothetical protein